MDPLVAAPKPRWFTPLRLLILFCFANIMVYLDRGEGARVVCNQLVGHFRGSQRRICDHTPFIRRCDRQQRCQWLSAHAGGP